MKRLSFFTPPGLGVKSGYGFVAAELLAAWNEIGIATDFNSPDNNVHISWVQPPWYMGREEQYLIGYSPWESSKIEDSWVFYMNNRAEIWTTASYCKQVFEAAGVTVPIHIFPHGVNSPALPIQYESPHFDKGANMFTFLHIGGGTERKGSQRVADAFIDLFDGRSDVRLIMKSTGPSEARYYDKIFENLHNVGTHPQITVYEDPLPQSGIQKLYSMADCVVYPSNGEGFGLIPFDGIAQGIPTIVTNGTAMKDYAHLSIPLECSPVEAYGVHLGYWDEPSQDNLKYHMARIVQEAEYKREKEHVLSGAEWLHANQKWTDVAQNMVTHLEEVGQL